MATTRDTVVIDDRCTACGSCLITCAPRALVRAPKKPLVIDDRCTGCGACVEICPVGAIDEFTVANGVAR
ncbi:MAG: 4Fe-4S binding protein [Actinomycetota bacterium]